MSTTSAPEIVQPAYLWQPDCYNTAGGEVADLAELAGMILDAEQRLILDVMFSQDRKGKWTAFELGLVCARQNLKTFVLQAATLGDLFLFDAKLAIWTAHLFDTSQEAFRDLDAVIAGTPHLARRVLRVSRANGDEGIELKSGGRLKFKARSKSGGRGLTGDVVTLDEAFALSAKEMGALLPTLSARPNPQVRYASSAGLDDSAILRGVRDRGRAGNDPSLAYIEWGAPQDSCEAADCAHQLDAAGCALDDIEKIRQANPALDRRIAYTTIKAERRALSTEPEEFARERLGWWSAAGSVELPYPLKDWKALADLGSTRAGPPAFAIDTNPIRSRSAIAACGARGDGLGHLEVVDYRPGTDWVVARAKELQDRWDAKFVMAVDGAAASLLPALVSADVAVTTYTSRQMVAACGALADAIRDKTVRHIDQDELNDAVQMARKRELEGAWALARKGGDIAPLVATVLAHHLWLGEQDDNYAVEDSIY